MNHRASNEARPVRQAPCPATRHRLNAKPPPARQPPPSARTADNAPSPPAYAFETSLLHLPRNTGKLLPSAAPNQQPTKAPARPFAGQSSLSLRLPSKRRAAHSVGRTTRHGKIMEFLFIFIALILAHLVGNYASNRLAPLSMPTPFSGNSTRGCG